MSHRTCGSSPPCTRHPIHACAPVCCVVVVFLFTSPVFYFVPPFSFQPFQMFTSEFNERSRSNHLCDFRLGTVATSDHETPLTIEAELIRTQSVSTMPSQQCRSRGCCGPDFVPYATSFCKERWHGGQVEAHLSTLEANKGRLQTGARVKGLSGAASNNTTTQHGRFNLSNF